MPLTIQQKQDKIRILDLEIWNKFAPKVRAHAKCPDSYWCYCPYCDKGKKQDTHNLTGLVYKHSNGDGLGYKCLSCGAAQPRVFRFLGGAGARAAEEYAEKRLEIDAVGKGWYCPNPQRKQQEEDNELDPAEAQVELMGEQFGKELAPVVVYYCVTSQLFDEQLERSGDAEEVK